MPFTLPRMPKIVVPTAVDPKSIILAAAATEDDVVDALVRGPLFAIGMALPKLPGPAGIVAQVAAGLSDGGQTIGPRSTAVPKSSNGVKTYKIGV